MAAAKLGNVHPLLGRTGCVAAFEGDGDEDEVPEEVERAEVEADLAAIR